MRWDLREPVAEDVRALRSFLVDIPADDRTFFKEDVTAPEVAERWATDDKGVRRLAVADDGTILAFAALLPGVERSSHVAEVVLVVAERARRHGLGRALARQMLLDAVQNGFRKVTVELAARSVAPIEMFRQIGFEPEALLRDQLRSPDGELHDIVVLAHAVEDNWEAMRAAGIDDAIG